MVDVYNSNGLIDTEKLVVVCSECERAEECIEFNKPKVSDKFPHPLFGEFGGDTFIRMITPICLTGTIDFGLRR